MYQLHPKYYKKFFTIDGRGEVERAHIIVKPTTVRRQNLIISPLIFCLPSVYIVLIPDW